MAYVTHYQQGLELARRFQADRALAEFEQCLAIRDNDPKLLFHRARMLLHVGKAEEAIEALERLAADEPGMLLVHQLRQTLYDSSGAFPDPERRASARDAVRTICGRLGDFDLELRHWLVSGSGPNPCEAMARGSLQTSNVPADSPMGRAAHAYARRFDMGLPATDAVKDQNRNAEAEQECRKLLDDCPGMVGLCAEHATWLRWSQIRFDVSASVDKPPMSSSITLDLAQQYFERALDASAMDSPSAHFALLGLGHVYRDMGDFDQAIQTYILVLEQPGVSPRLQYEAHFNLALAHYKTGDLDKARPHVKWVQVRPGNSIRRLALVPDRGGPPAVSSRAGF